MLGEGASSHRTRQDAREIQRSNAGQRTAAAREGLWITLTELDDFNNWLRRQHLCMWMLKPLLIGTDHTTTETCLVDSSFEIERIPFGDSVGDGVRIRFAVEQLQHACLQIGQTKVGQHPASVLCPPWLGNRSHVLVIV